MNPPATFPILAPSQLSVHIKSLRKTRGMTQTELGLRIGVKQARIADIEKNPGAVSLDQLLQLLHALDTRLLLAVPTLASTPVPPAQGSATDW